LVFYFGGMAIIVNLLRPGVKSTVVDIGSPSAPAWERPLR